MFGGIQFQQMVAPEFDPDRVISLIHTDIEKWEAFLKSDNSIHLSLIVQILGKKICCTDTLLKQKQLDIVAKITTGSFLNALKNECDSISYGTSEKSSPKRFLEDLAAICSFITHKMPNTALDYILNLIPAAISACQEEKEVELQETFNVLKRELRIMIEDNKSNEKLSIRQRRHGFTDFQEAEMHQMEAPNDFRNIDVLPTARELLSDEEPFLIPNKKCGAYQDANHYLDLQFRLYREDFIRPLKLGIKDFMEHK